MVGLQHGVAVVSQAQLHLFCSTHLSVLVGVQESSPFTVRALPRIAFGAHPGSLDGLSPDNPGVVVLHHYKGTWKLKGISMLTPATVGSLLSRAYRFLLLRCGCLLLAMRSFAGRQLAAVTASSTGCTCSCLGHWQLGSCVALLSRHSLG